MRVVEQQSRGVRKKLRLVDFDYSTPGYYFVTVCVSARRCILGDVDESRASLHDLGQLVSEVLQRTPQRHPNVRLDAFVVMPNHLHALLELAGTEVSLPAVMGAFKSLSTNAARGAGMIADAKLWQRGFHDHVVRDDAGLDRLREYIANNPLKWHLD